MQKTLLSLLLAFTFHFISVESKAQSAGYQFQVREMQLIANANYTILAVGHFDSARCERILAIEDETKVTYLMGIEAQPVPVSGLGDSETWKGSAVIDVDSDGLSDLIQHDSNDSHFRIAIANGGGRFTVYRPEVPHFLKSSPPLSFFAALRDRKPAIVTQSQNRLYWLSYLAGIGLVGGEGGDIPAGTKLSGVLAPISDALSSKLIFSTLNDGNEILLQDDDALRPVWLEFPIPNGRSDIFFGDFNADGQTDVLTGGSAFNNWWIGINKRSFGLEYPVSGLRDFGSSAEESVVGDIDCSRLVGLVDRKIRGGVMKKATLIPDQVTAAKTSVGSAASNSSESSGPFVCVGYLPKAATHKWSIPTLCSEKYGVISSRKDANIPLGSCCRLPFDDVLTDEHVSISSGSCPDDFVVTGFQLPKSTQSIPELRCTKINTAKYRLGTTVPGIHWGFGRARADEKRSLNKERFPETMRYALGRFGFQTWDKEGCVSAIPYGLLSAWTGKHCENQLYRAIFPSASSSNDEAREALRLFPDCHGTIDRFDPNAGCVEVRSATEPKPLVKDRTGE